MSDILHKKAKLVMFLRSQGIMRPHILSALERVPREAFVPKALVAHAYENVSLPIAGGQTISQPFIVARMTEALEVNKHHRILEIGTGSGYQAAILSHLCRRVYTMERLRPLLVAAENKLRSLQVSNVTFRYGDGYKGWPEAAPFDRIIITCQSDTLPDILVSQLKVGGILVAPVGVTGHEELIVVRRTEEGADVKTLMPVRFVPMLKGTEQ